MKFDLVSLFPDYTNSQWEYNVFYLQAMLKACGHQSSVFFLLRINKAKFFRSRRLLPTREELALMVEKLKNADLIGLSVFHYNIDAAKELTTEIKRTLRTPVIWGGPYPTLSPEECMGFADMLCLGEGEEAAAELANALSRDKDICGIKNLWIKKAGRNIKNDPRPPCCNLDKLPFPDFPRQDYDYVSCEGKFIPHDYKEYGVLASRGCIFSCSYCLENIWRLQCKVRKNYRTRSPENIIKEIRMAIDKSSIERVFFLDALFPFNHSWIEKFSLLYKSQVRLPFIARFFPSLLKKEDFLLLKEAGLFITGISLESGSERMRKTIFNRPLSNAHILNTHNLIIKTEGVKLYYYLIVDNPWETEKDKQEAFDLLINLSGRFRLRLFSLLFFPKHDITEKGLQEGLVNQYHLDWAKGPRGALVECFYKRSGKETAWITLMLLMSLHYRYGLPPKKLIVILNRCSFIKLFPYPLFFLAYFADKVLFSFLEARQRTWRSIKLLLKLCYDHIISAR